VPDGFVGGRVEKVQPAGAKPSSSSSPRPAALVIEACSTGGASIVKIAWISVPRPSVTPAVTSTLGQAASANALSSKSEGWALRRLRTVHI
jgi:hypothetical protein